MVEKISEIKFSEPLIAANSFACTMHMHVTMKEHGDMDMTELCVYDSKRWKNYFRTIFYVILMFDSAAITKFYND